MHMQSRPPGTTTYQVTVRREQAAELTVDAAGPGEALDLAHERIGAGEILVWATVEGSTLAVAEVAPVDEPARAVA